MGLVRDSQQEAAGGRAPRGRAGVSHFTGRTGEEDKAGHRGRLGRGATQRM